MPFQLSRMEEADIPEFAKVDELAMVDWSLARAMNKVDFKGMSRARGVEALFRQGFSNDFQHDRGSAWMKVTDTATHDLVAAALWKFFPGGGEPEAEPPPEAVGLAAQVDVEPAEERPSVMRTAARISKGFTDEFVGTKPHAYLCILITHPAYQRRGAGGMLVQWGCDKADDLGWISVLDASPAGIGLYRKHGFEVKREAPMDLRPFGVDEISMRTGMLREPKTKAKAS